MMTATKLGGGELGYYERDVDRAPEGVASAYYDEHGEAPPRAWIAERPEAAGVTAAALGVEHGEQLSREQVEGWFDEAQAPGTGAQMGQAFRSGSVHGFDLTVAAPKSVSLLWALGSEEQQAGVDKAHSAALERAQAYLATHAAYSQQRPETGAPAQIVQTAGLSGAVYDHRTSRAGDPHLHTHMLLNNKQMLANGSWGALDGNSIYHEMRAAGTVYQAALRTELTRELGVQWQAVDPKSGMADLAGIDRETIEAWSDRHSQIREWAESRSREDNPSAAELSAAQRATRGEKISGASDQELRNLWSVQAMFPGHEVDTERLGFRDDLGVTDDLMPSPEAVLAHATERRATVTRADLMESAGALVPPVVEGDVLEVLERLVDETQAVAMPLGVPREGEREGAASRRMTSAEVVREEARALDASARPHDLPGRAEDVPQEVNGKTLTEAQHAAMQGLVSDPARVSVLVAPAGAGKTTALGAARAGWEASGLHVVGLAPTGRAASAMRNEGVSGSADTLATMQGKLSRGVAPWSDPERAVVVVDEAGMVGNRDMAQLIEQAEALGSRVVMVGDPSQLGAVDQRGGMFATLARDLPGTQQLGEVWRQREQWERDATKALRSGDPARIAAAAREYDEHGRIAAGTPHAMLDAAFEGWKADVLGGNESSLLAPTWEIAGALNVRAQEAMATAGVIDREAGAYPLAGGERAHVGDSIITRKNDYQLKLAGGGRDGDVLRNGDRWTVTEAGVHGGLTLQSAEGSVVTVPAEYLAEHARLGYASTIHSAQGATVDRAHVILDGDRTDAQLAYVGMSRGRDSNNAYVMQGRDVEHQVQHEHPDTAPEPESRVLPRDEAREAFEQVAGRDRAAESAHDLAARLGDRDEASPQAAEINDERMSRRERMEQAARERSEAQEQARSESAGLSI